MRRARSPSRCISPISPLYLPISPLYLPYISPDLPYISQAERDDEVDLELRELMASMGGGKQRTQREANSGHGGGDASPPPPSSSRSSAATSTSAAPLDHPALQSEEAQMLTRTLALAPALPSPWPYP